MTSPQNLGYNPLAYEGVKATTPANVIRAQRAPVATDFQEPGTIWLNEVTNITYNAGVPVAGAAVWNASSGSAGIVSTLTGDSGTATPSSGNIQIAGGTNLTSSAAGAIVTVNLDATVAGLTSLSSTTINTNVAAAQLVLNATTLSATGTDANVSLSLATKGTGSVLLTRSAAGVDINYQATNSDNTDPASHGGFQAAVGGASAGDPYVLYTVSGAQSWITGIDNSDSDSFVIAASSALGTSNIVRWTTAGAMTCSGAMTATTGAITANNGNFVLNTAGNKIISTNVGSGAAAGANSFGTATLTAGTVTVATTAVTASSIIFLTRQSPGATGAAALGILSVGTIVASTSFVINALQAADSTAVQASDVSVVGWMIIN